MIDVAPERITELRAEVAARLATVPVLLTLPPATELTRLVLIDRATDEAALLAARWAALVTVAVFCAAAFSAAACSRWRWR